MVFAGLLLVCGVVHAAPENQSPYRIVHYDLRIEPDFAARTIRVSASIKIDNPSLTRTFSFGLADAYKVVSAGASGAEVNVRRGDGEIAVELRRPQRKPVLYLELSAAPGKSQDEERPVIEDNSLFLLWSDRWYPIDFDQWATLRTTVLLPPNFQVIAPGKLISVRKRGDKTEHVFNTTHPTVSFSVLADTRWTRSERQVGGFHIITLLHPESRKYAAEIFSTSADVLKFFSELHGDYPFDQFAFVTIPGMYARRAFAGWIGYSPEYLQKEMERTGYDAHETSLLWWGLTSHGSGSGSWQWTEGLGDYVEVMYGEARKKPLPQNFVRFRSDYLATPPEQDVPYDQLRGDTPQKIIHGKYPWTMQVMRELIGDPAFRRGIRLLFDRYRFRTFSMDEFIATFEEAAGQSLSWWREQWLNRKGMPVVDFESSVAASGNRFRISCKLEQEGALYDLPLEIGIKTGGITRIEKILLRGRTSVVTFESAEPPGEIVLDPNERILMKKVRR